MRNIRLSRPHLQLHLVVFLWGFTGILGKLISVDALPLVWHRVAIALVSILTFLLISRINFRLPARTFLKLGGFGIIIGLHWLAFFHAIKISNVSVTLACLASGSFFAAILEPLLHRRRPLIYELGFGLIAFIGLYLIFRFETRYVAGILMSLLCSFLSALFSVLNASVAKKYHPAVIGFYEMLGALLVLSSAVYLYGTQGFTATLTVTNRDYIYLLILGIACTAFAFIASVSVLKFITPYSVMLTINLEPVYGILMAYFIFGENEKMTWGFYTGTLVVLLTVFADAVIKKRGVTHGNSSSQNR